MLAAVTSIQTCLMCAFLPHISHQRRATGRYSSGGSCLWVSILTELVRSSGSTPNRYATRGSRTRNLASRMFEQLFLDFPAHITSDIFESLQYHYLGSQSAQRYPTREAYLSRLQMGESLEGQQHWGSDFDIAIAAICTERPIYTIRMGASTYTRYDPSTGLCQLLSSLDAHMITELDIVIVNNGNRHWMPTEIC